MFYGSDTHAEEPPPRSSSLVASCRLHRIDPFAYLEEVLRVLAYWPRDRYPRTRAGPLGKNPRSP
ncbi:MAG: transposase domain-containing protein [Myxococcales bacterium]|nr:transposase domain-containing protein [Myxococcales bacterium]